MKLRFLLEMIELGNEIVAVPVGENSSSLSGILKVNQEGQEILDLLKDDISEEEIIKNLSDKYENGGEIEKYVHNFVDYLKSHNMVE